MPKKTLLITVSLILTFLFAHSQNFEKQFNELYSKNDTSGQEQLLKQWEMASPKDPELFIAYYNFYVKKCMTEVLSMDRDKKQDESLVLTDTGTGKPVAYISSDVMYEPILLQKGFSYLERGISLHPTRLDMRFGKIYMLGKNEDYSAFTTEIIKTIDYGYQINQAWLWKEGKPLDDSKGVFLGSIQDYIMTLYKTEDDDLLPNMRQISETVLKYYPDHVESLSNIAITFLIKAEYDKALEYLLRAEKIAPKDIIVLNNIAEAYTRKKDTANAKSYFEKIIKYGNKEEAQDARARMKRL